MQYTENYGYKKPEYGEKAKIDDLNYNATLSDNLMKNTRDMLAEYFSQTKAYKADDVVQLEGKMYRFKVDHAAGNFNPAEVDEEPLGNMLGSSMPPITEEAEGNPITFTDGADAPLVECKAEIVATQDLHGYDKPWVGGAGKNGINVDGQVFSYSSNDPISIATFNAVEGTTYTISCYQDKALASSIRNTIQYQLAGESVYENTTSNYHPEAGRHSLTITAATSGTAYVFFWCHTPSDTTITYSKFMVEIGSTATTYSPYSNICPISGYDEVEIDGCGKNLFDVSSYPFTDGIYIYAINGTEVITTGFSAVLGFIPCEHLAGKTVTLNHRPSGYNPGFAFYSDAVDTSYISGIPNSGGSVGTSWTITIPTDAKYMRFTVPTDNKNDIQIELGSTATTYEPYTPNSYTISLGSTRYGGELDVSRGVLRVTHGYVDLGDLTWTKSADYKFYATSFLTMDFNNNVILNGACCEIYPIGNYISWGNGSMENMICGVKSTHVVYVRDERFTDLTDFQNAIDGYYLCYPLATPLEISLTPTQVRSLLGNNYLSCNSGDLAIEYYTQDWQKIIDLIEKESGDKHTYSTSEKVVGTWIDGSTIYEKTIMTSSVTTGDNTIPHGITNAGRLIQSFGSVYAGTTLNWLNIPNVSSNSAYVLNVYNFNSTSFNFEVGSALSTLTDVQITLRYTKSS